MKQPRDRRDEQGAFVLHAYPYRETSLIVEALTAEHGRVALVARGARRPRSELRGILQAFQPLNLSWAGGGELRTLLRAEWRGGLPLVAGSALLCGFYLNELLLKLLPREDPHPQLFRDYEAALTRLAAGHPQAPILREFEVRLLSELGYALPLTHEADTGRPVDPSARYYYAFDLGPRSTAAEPGRRYPLVRGATLLALAQHDYSTADAAAEAKRLMREVLDHYLEQRAIFSRRVVRDLQALDDGTRRKRRTTIMIELGVNIDHVATLRQARRTYEPDPVWAAAEAHLGGADGITVHLREDRRHIQDEDVRRLRALVQIKLNLEMAATDEMVALACALKPEMAMLVPEGREEVTTEGGLDVAAQEARLKTAVSRLAEAGIISSVFIDAEVRQVEAAARIGARVCEIHTGPYAHAFHAKGRDPQSAAVVAELAKIREAGAAIRALGMRFNAGHALNYFNVQSIAAMPGVRELHIGHAIVSRAVFVGLREAVRQMKALLREAAAG